MTFDPYLEPEVVMTRAVMPDDHPAAPGITARDVALRLYDQDYVPATLPRREEDLALAILRAFEGAGIRFGDLPARSADLVAIRQHLDLITREAERLGRSLECERYRPAFVKPLGRG